MTSPLELALDYAAQGLRVFPCLERDGAMPNRKHGAPYYNQALGLVHGFQDATTDADRIRSWWLQWPGALVGMPTGAGRLVLDIDAKGEVDGWLTLEERGWEIPADAPRVRTASGGAHVVFEAPPFRVTISAGEIGPGLDIRCEGGYVIAAGSVREDGEYQWVVGDHESYLSPGRLPTWLLTRLMELAAAKQRRSEPQGEGRPSSAWGRATLERECETVRSAPKGTRNTVLNKAAFKVGQAVGGGSLDEDMARGALYQAAIDAGLKHAEIIKTIASGLGDGIKEPRYPSERDNGYDYNPDHNSGPTPEPPQGDGAPPIGEPAREEPRKGRLLSEAEFLETWRPPDWLVEALIQRGYVYTLTGNTGHGKTALALLLAYGLALGYGFAGKESLTGTVAFFAGENADNVKTQWLALRRHYRIPDSEALKVVWYDRPFSIGASQAELVAELGAITDLVLVVVDSLQAFFRGDNENDNTQMLKTAVEIRGLCQALSSRPAGLILAHPVKRATKQDLLPRGGSAITNELDGNMTLWLDDRLAELSWQGKWRGPPFEPMSFEMLAIEPPGMVDAKGKQMTVTIAQVAGPQREAELHAEKRRAMKRVLELIARNPRISVLEIGVAIGQKKSGGSRMRQELVRRKLVKETPVGLQLTDDGKAFLEASQT